MQSVIRNVRDVAIVHHVQYHVRRRVVQDRGGARRRPRRAEPDAPDSEEERHLSAREDAPLPISWRYFIFPPF